MPLARDNSNLPKATPRRREDGWRPDAEVRFGSALVDLWHAEGIQRDLHFRDGEHARFFHSSAASCSRAVAYAALGVPESDPVDAPGHFVTRMGQIMHEALQEALVAAFPGAQIEVKVEEGERAGHADFRVDVPRTPDEEMGSRYWAPEAGHPDYVICGEAKSMGGFAYKQAIGERGPAQGPKHEHVVQVSLNAKGMDADEAVLVYLARDAISIPAARRISLPEINRVTAEWTLDRQTYEAVADTEITRITAILRMVDSGVLPARKIPDPELPPEAVITDPATGTWKVLDENGTMTDTNTAWQCLYCHWQTTCTRTGMGRSPVEDLYEIGVLIR